MFDAATIRKDFPILDRVINGKPLIYLDSASTTQKPAAVIDALTNYYRTINANVHRGAYTLADEATAAYEEARTKIAAFINAPRNEVVFTRGTTTGINHISIGWALRRLGKGDRILLTIMEHHSNVVPWQLVADLTGAELVYLDLDDDFEVDLSGLDDVIDERVRIVAVSGMSNVTGTIGPVGALATAAHAVGAIVVVDGAQLVPHAPVDVATLGADFLVFSSHKMARAYWHRRPVGSRRIARRNGSGRGRWRDDFRRPAVRITMGAGTAQIRGGNAADSPGHRVRGGDRLPV